MVDRDLQMFTICPILAERLTYCGRQIPVGEDYYRVLLNSNQTICYHAHTLPMEPDLAICKNWGTNEQFPGPYGRLCSPCFRANLTREGFLW